MAWPKNIRTEHGGAKNSSAKDGWWGYRDEAKRYSRKARRRIDKLLARSADDRRRAAVGRRELQKLAEDLRRLAAFMSKHQSRSHGERQWQWFIEELRAAAEGVESGDPSAAQRFLDKLGGMGSMNDAVFDDARAEIEYNRLKEAPYELARRACPRDP